MSEVIAADYGGVFGLEWQWQEGGGRWRSGSFVHRVQRDVVLSLYRDPNVSQEKKQNAWGAPLCLVISATSNNKHSSPSTPPCVMSERAPAMMTPPHTHSPPGPPRTCKPANKRTWLELAGQDGGDFQIWPNKSALP